jgi:Zn-finger nucleic acid-binding protein
MGQTKADAQHIYMHCQKCEGSALTAAALCRLVQSRHVMQILDAAKNQPPGKAKCPGCPNLMRLVTVPNKSGTYELDACAYCNMVWFDRDELKEAPTVPYMETISAEEDYQAMKERMYHARRLQLFLSCGILPGPVGDAQIVFDIVRVLIS